MIKLSRRLQTVAQEVCSGGVVADIGCDHGFTSIYMVEQGLAERVIAMDINEGPLERAKQHIVQYNMEELIETRLSDGARCLCVGEADTLLISGMGGALICRILGESLEVAEAAGELVLSPQSEPFLVRHFLLEHGFRIDREQMLEEQGKYYVVLHAVRGSQSFAREEEYLFGKYLIDMGNDCLEAFLEKEQQRILKILSAMEKKKMSPSGFERQNSIKEKLKQVQWALRACQKNGEHEKEEQYGED